MAHCSVSYRSIDIIMNNDIGSLKLTNANQVGAYPLIEENHFLSNQMSTDDDDG